MSLPNSPLNQEFAAIQKSPNVDAPLIYKAIIHIPNKNLNYTCLKVLSIDIDRDYENKLSDDITLTVAVLPGTWTDIILPQISNLEVSLVSSSSTLFRGNVSVTKYKAYCKTPVNIRKLNSNYHDLSTESINMGLGPIDIQFQLVPVLIEKLIPIQIGTNVVDATTEETLKSLLMGESSKLEGLDDANMLKGVDMVPGDNQQKYRSIPIPDGVSLLNLPNYLQKKSFGIYKQGLGHYIQNAIWYVYPKFRVKRDDSNIRYINVFVSYRNQLKHNTKTYRIEGPDLYLIGTLEAESSNNKSANMLNEGNGIRAINPQAQQTEEVLKVEGNKAIASRTNSMNEFILEENKNGTQNARIDLQAQDINLYEQVANVEGRMGRLFALVWQNSSPPRVKPGAIVKIHYMSGNQAKIVEGILMKAHHYIQAVSPNMTDLQYSTTTGLFIFVRDKSE